MKGNTLVPRTSLTKRFKDFLGERWFRMGLFFRFHWWVALLVLLVGGVWAFWWRGILPYADYQSAQWALSTEVQSLAALLGIILVGVTILWSQAAGEEGRLRELQPKYYELLRSGGDSSHVSPTVIEELRMDYLKKIKERSLPREVFPYKHGKYHKHKDLFVDVCRVSELVNEYFGLGKLFDTIETDLKSLRFSQDQVTDKVLVTWYDLKSDSREFLELVTDIFHPGNNTVYFELAGGQNLVDRIWDLTLLQHTETALARSKRFNYFRTVWFRLGFALYVLAITIGLLALSGTTSKTVWRPPFAAAITLGLSAVIFTILFVHILLRSE